MTGSSGWESWRRRRWLSGARRRPSWWPTPWSRWSRPRRRRGRPLRAAVARHRAAGGTVGVHRLRQPSGVPPPGVPAQAPQGHDRLRPGGRPGPGPARHHPSARPGVPTGGRRHRRPPAAVLRPSWEIAGPSPPTSWMISSPRQRRRTTGSAVGPRRDRPHDCMYPRFHPPLGGTTPVEHAWISCRGPFTELRWVPAMSSNWGLPSSAASQAAPNVACASVRRA